jgi:hypothetical protein
METTNPRFEFRIFANKLSFTEQLFQQYASKPVIRESSEIYIVSSKTNTHNTKIRYDLLDIKRLLKTEKGFEQWSPVLKASFPLSKEIINELFFVFNTRPPQILKSEYSLAEFIADIIQPHPDLYSVNVTKKRWGYMINNCISELAEVQIDNKFIKTAAIESTEISDILKTIKMLQMDQYKNTNYLVAIKQVMKISI